MLLTIKGTKVTILGKTEAGLFSQLCYPIRMTIAKKVALGSVPLAASLVRYTKQADNVKRNLKDEPEDLNYFPAVSQEEYSVKQLFTSESVNTGRYSPLLW